ncbi:MAG: transcription elongation factor GreA [Candidatus Cloacimonetes bacterium]|nr:transcription elongation factor GreA [Candidatus Cloacimonadota bacterium]MDD2424133.1 transcription elongation factor GreA [Candidatus Cloacimonadota bacterium]MDD4277547.1 transcription elongation factor GreA [Candidatus Cloacimonadota bacterium]MDY0326405.1 transcription elongation factor GreA [Candidatus Cloacimonadaceae bacterium]
MDLSVFITTIGMERLQKRINDLMAERPEVIKSITIAREFGDLSENAEYKAARERQRAIDSEIDYLRRRSAQLKVVDPSGFSKDVVRFGSSCRASDCKTDEELVFKVVGAAELNFYEDEDDLQVVSVVSPIGKGLLGKKPQEIAVISAPMGERRLKILEIL